MITPWMTAISAERTICETTREIRLTGVARKRGSTSRSRSLIIAIPLQVAPKKEFMITIAGARNVMYEVVPKPPPGSCVTRLKSWP